MSEKYNNFPQCPYCNYLMQDDYYDYITGEVEELECESCLKMFTTQSTTDISFTSNTVRTKENCNNCGKDPKYDYYCSKKCLYDYIGEDEK